MTKKSVKLVREGKYAAEVDIDLHYSDESWSPTMSADDARKLDVPRSVKVKLRSEFILDSQYIRFRL
jgi:hypothetical protein